MYKEKEGIDLQNVAKNPGRKQVAKLLLNRYWAIIQEVKQLLLIQMIEGTLCYAN